MPDHTTTIHKDGRTISVVTDKNGDQTVTTALDNQPSPAADLSTAIAADNANGTAIATTSHTGQPAPIVLHRHRDGSFHGPDFVFGMMIGALLLHLFQRNRRRRVARAAEPVTDVSQHDVAALARRTANLERIITDPATRTANEIEALR